MLDDRIQGVEPSKPIVEVARRLEPKEIDLIVEVLHPAALVERHQVAAEPMHVHLMLQRAAKQLVVELICMRQFGAWERIKRAQEFPALAVSSFDRLHARVRPQAVVTPVAEP